MGEDDGECFLHSGEEVQWASDSLAQPLFWDASVGRLCVVRQEKQVFLDDLVAERFPTMEVSYIVVGVGKVCVEVSGWPCPRHGSRLWWNALHVHKSLALTAQRGDASRWAEHGWARWKKVAVQDFMLEEGALLRKAIGYSVGEGEGLDQRQMQGNVVTSGLGADFLGHRYTSFISVLGLS